MSACWCGGSQLILAGLGWGMHCTYSTHPSSFWDRLSAWACPSHSDGRDTRAQATRIKLISSFWLCHSSINIPLVKAGHIAKSTVKGQGNLYLQRETAESCGRGHGYRGGKNWGHEGMPPWWEKDMWGASLSCLEKLVKSQLDPSNQEAESVHRMEPACSL